MNASGEDPETDRVCERHQAEALFLAFNDGLFLAMEILWIVDRSIQVVLNSFTV